VVLVVENQRFQDDFYLGEIIDDLVFQLYGQVFVFHRVVSQGGVVQVTVSTD
jgi:hypothetical protein